MGGSNSRSYDVDDSDDSSSDSDDVVVRDNSVQADAIARSILTKGKTVEMADVDASLTRMQKLWAFENAYSRDVIFIESPVNGNGNGKGKDVEVPPHWRRVSSTDAVAVIKEVKGRTFVTMSTEPRPAYLVRFRDTAATNTNGSSSSSSSSSATSSSPIAAPTASGRNALLGGIKRLHALHGVASCIQ